MKSGRIRAAGGIVLMCSSALVVGGCGGGKTFKNDPRPAVPVQLTGVITDKEVTISPKRVGAGPVILNISNQAKTAHTITLDGEGATDTVGPVNPLGTGQLQQTLKQGTYTIKAGSKTATTREIKPFVLTVGKARPSSSNQLLLP